MKEIIEFIKECDIEDLLAFPLLTVGIAMLWLLAYAVGYR